ncbi:MAG: hypothetical protein V2J26_12695 [Pacificimonas sp.]|jgi:hypothetical protein|nr:hypothetical protein [Pacificimonas sp.]
MPKLLFPVLCAVVAGCGNYSLPTEAEQATAIAALPGQFAPVSRSDRVEGQALTFRWALSEPNFSPEEWSWQEVEVTVEAGAAMTEAVTIRRSVSIDPAALSSDVPASFSRGAWGLVLRCAELGCVTVEEHIEIREGDTVVEAREQTRRPRGAEWLFDTYELRDETTVLVRRALGAPPR